MKKLRYLLILFFLYPLSLLAQQTVTISGKVTDKADGSGLPGATVSAGAVAVGTDANGNYRITVPESATDLTFNFVGMAGQTEKINGRSVINISLSTTQAQLQEVVVVGYGTQKRETITGSVSTLKGKDITVTKNESVVNSLTGKIPGLRIQQRTSEPGGYNNVMNIRGFQQPPLIVIDGVIAGTDQSVVGRMDPNEIENISVLKDAAASIYGIRASGGVLLITTKKGEKNGKFDFNYSVNQSWQQFVGMPESVGAIDFMMLTNEKRKHNFDNNFLSVLDPVYSYADFEPYLNGTKQSSDWNAVAFREFAQQVQHNFNINGGSEKITYFFNFGYQKQDGVFKTGDINYNKYNVRSNVTVDIVKGLKAQALMSGWIDNKFTPFQDQWTVYKYAWNVIPTKPIFANNNPEYPAVIDDNVNPAVVTDADKGGFRQRKNRNFTGQLNLQYQIPGITGLTAKALYNYQYDGGDNKDVKRTFNLYTYDAVNDDYIPSLVGSPAYVQQYYSTGTYTQSQLGLNYVNTFFNDHNVSATLVYEQSHQLRDNFNARRDTPLPIDYIFGGIPTTARAEMGTGINDLSDIGYRSVLGRFNYDYKGRYLAEFSFRRDASNKYKPGADQWGFFPAVSVGWVLTKENFFRDLVSENILTSLKIRASWGEQGDELGQAFNYVNGYDYPAYSYLFGNTAVNGSVQRIGNAGLSWAINTKKNLALDFTLLNGAIDGTFEAFRSDLTGINVRPSVALPGTVGAMTPEINYEANRVEGIDLNVSYRKKLGEVGLNVSANIGTTRMKRTKILQGPQGNAYNNWRNNQLDRYTNIWWGREYEGQFTNYNQIYNFPVNTGGGNQGVVPGDYYYKDWNEDGVIDGKDERPIATIGIPLYNYGANIAVNYKNFDLNVLLQGAAGVYVQYGEQFASPLMYNRSALTRFLDSWHTVDPEANIYDPNTQWVPGFYPSMGSPDATGTKAVQDASYLRIKTLEFGYTLPATVLSKIGVKRFRVYANSYNLLTFTGLKNYDPEHLGTQPGQGFDVDFGGYTYPMNRTFSVGANISF